MTTLAAQYAPLAYPAIVYGIGIALSAAVAFAIVGAIVGRLMARRTRRHQLDDEYAALDHGEPSRAAVERGYDHPPCCSSCDGKGGTYSGPCWDCQGTGHAHAPDPPSDVERAAMDALARAEADRDLDRIQGMTDDAFLDAMTAGRPHLRAIRDSQAEARSLDAEWEQIQANGWRS